MLLITKVGATLLLLFAVGVPVLETWEAILLGSTSLAVLFGVPRRGYRYLAAAAVVVIACVGLKSLLPRADIAEAHNAFLVKQAGEPLQRALPPEVFASWKSQFDALYPPDPASAQIAPYQWRLMGGTPETWFTESSDAIWRKAKYTRQVDAIDFRSLGEFRGGFANDLRYNFWQGQLLREEMPFYVMYELTRASIESRLVWKGQLFWQKADGSFEEIVHPQVAARVIESEDAGKRVYVAFFPKRDRSFDFAFEPSRTLLASRWASILLTIACGLAVLLLTHRGPWFASIQALLIFAAGYLLSAGFVSTRPGAYLGRSYPPHAGGDDGLLHDAYGRSMAMLVRQGDLVQAFKGFEDVYWFTPGTRYFRMVEKLLFGDTNHLYTLVLACLPILVFYLMRHFVRTYWAGVTTAVFCVLLVGNFTLFQYVDNANRGYGEALGGALYLLGLVLMLRSQPTWGGTDGNLRTVAVAGAALAASMFMRPNFAFAVVWLGAAFAVASWRLGNWRLIAALAMGLGFALWMPAHNLMYGGEFYLISKSGATLSVPLGIGDYAAALGDVARGRDATEAVSATSEQLSGWLFDRGYVVREELMPVAVGLHAVRLLALCLIVWVAVRWVRDALGKGTDLAVVAIAAIFAHIPMLFIFSTNYRYAMFGWDLSLIVLCIWCARLGESRSSLRA